MAQQQVSQAYLMGIRDERALLNSLKAEGADLATEAKAMLANIESTIAQGFAGEMLDYMRGGRDFWKGQLARLEA